jgi:uncharacterized protein (DUF2225 family)
MAEENRFSNINSQLKFWLKDDKLVEEYIAKYGPAFNMKHIQSIQTQIASSLPDDGTTAPALPRKPVTKKLTPEEEEALKEDPLYSVKVQCPSCKRKNIDHYELRAKSQQVSYTKFYVPVYQGTMEFRTVDFNRVAVTVCPQCLFASPDKKDFLTFSSITKNEQASQIGHIILGTLLEKTAERKGLLKNVPDYEKYFTQPRSLDGVLASYQLAMARTQVEAFYETPYALYKLGAYSLKVARILQMEKKEYLPMLEEAQAYLEESFSRSECPSEGLEYQVLYLVVAIALRRGDQQKAGMYISTLERILSEKKHKASTDPKINILEITRWHGRIKNLWEDRATPELFDE